MSTNLSSVPKLQFFDNNGNPLVGGKLYTYAAGTSTPLATYTDSSGVTPNTNPIILDSRGEANVWLTATQYKFELKTSADALIWTVDNISNALNLSQLLASSGSAANPPYTFAADTDTGMYLAAVGQIGLSANGTPVFRSTDTQAVLDVNLQVSGTARRITGDFSNATVASRTMFQTSTTNGNTAIFALPNGTSTTATWAAINNSDPANASFGSFGTDGTTSVRILSGLTGTGTYLPMTFYTGGSERVRIDTSGNVGIGTNAPAHTLDINVASASFRVRNATGGNDFTVKSVAGPITQIGSVANTPLQILTNDVAQIHVTAAGNVGVGTTGPGDKLVVAAPSGQVYAAVNNGTVNTIFGLSAGNDNLIGTTTNHSVTFIQNSVSRGRFDTSGNFQFNNGYGSVATAYGCRAWINFDGTAVTNPASMTGVRGSGNVSSVLDNGTGDYTINFTNAMPDGNYAAVGLSKEYDGTTGTTLNLYLGKQTVANTLNANFVRVFSGTGGSGTATDGVAITVAVFR